MRARGKTTLRLLLVAVLVGGIVWGVANRDLFAAENLESMVEDLGPWGPVVYVLLYAIAALLFLPGSVLTLAGGALFGPVWGTVYTMTGATVGATAAFLVSRYLAGDWVSRRVGGRLKTLVEGVEEQGWRFVAFVRLVPVFPFNLLNYALGLTRIRLSHYILASVLCMTPGAFAYTYLGYAGRQAASEGTGAIKTIAIAVAIVGGVAMIPIIIKRWKAQRRPATLTTDAIEGVPPTNP